MDKVEGMKLGLNEVRTAVVLVNLLLDMLQ